jgi:transcriptional regulator with PAS, ATPase and Fis domain
MQPKLLRVLEEKEFDRVGGTRLIRSDFRLIAVTNQNLEEMVTAGKFRRDLFYRLNVFRLHIPPLRERRNDIIPLATHILLNLSQEAGIGDIALSELAQKALKKHDWPGNVRELSNVLERTLSTLNGHTIDLCDLPFYLHRARLKPRDVSHRGLKSIHAQTETEAIRFALAENSYNKTKTAKMLGINRTLLYKKMSRYNIKLEPE